MGENSIPLFFVLEAAEFRFAYIAEKLWATSAFAHYIRDFISVAFSDINCAEYLHIFTSFSSHLASDISSFISCQLWLSCFFIIIIVIFISFLSSPDAPQSAGTPSSLCHIRVKSRAT